METTPNEEVSKTTPNEEDSANDFDFESLFAEESDPEAEEAKFLSQVNKIENRDYKSIEDWAKTNTERKKIADKFYSEQGRKKSDETQIKNPVVGDKYAEKLLKLENPKAQFVIDELKEVAKERGIDILEAWDRFSWIRKEADSRAEEAEEKEKNGKKPSRPSQKIAGKGTNVELSEADRALLLRRPGLMEKFNK